MKVLVYFSLAFLTVACGIQREDSGRIDSLNRENAQLNQQKSQLQTERDQLAAEKSELDKRIDRMLSCNKHFVGNMGQRIEKEIRLVRETQRVQRFDCDNKQVSDQKETVVSPRAVVALDMLPALRDSQFEVSVYNRMTCARPAGGFYRGGGLLSESRSPYLAVNRSNTLFDHEVEPGLNEIDLSLCPKGQRYCSNPTFIATVALNVGYEEQHKNEILVVKPSPEYCARKQKK